MMSTREIENGNDQVADRALASGVNLNDSFLSFTGGTNVAILIEIIPTEQRSEQSI